MKALTIQQPMASAVIYGGKWLENRSRRMRSIPDGGLLVAVHSGARYWHPTQGTSSALCHEAVRYAVDRWHGLPVDLQDAEQLPMGVILGVARIVACHDLEKLRRIESSDASGKLGARERLVLASRWAEGPFCLEIDRVWSLDEPIPCRGALSLWSLDEKIGRDLERIVSFDEGRALP